MLNPRHIMALGGVSTLLFAFAPAAMAAPIDAGTCPGPSVPGGVTNCNVDVYGQVNAGSLSITPQQPVNTGTDSGANAVGNPWNTTLVTTGNPASAQYSETVGTYDDTGSGAGWHTTITSTEYTGIGGNALTSGGNNGGAPFEFGASGDSNLTSPTIPENSTIGLVNTTNVAGSDSYQASPGPVGSGNGLVIPQGGATGAPTTGVGAPEPIAATYDSAGLGTGMGDFNVTLPVTVVVPADAYAGEYQSTLTLAINTGP